MLGIAIIKSHCIEIFFVFCGHFHAGRRNEGDRAIELGQRVTERVHRAHPHIADGNPAQTVNCAFFAQHGVEIGQNLGGMFAPAVTAVDHGDGCPFCGFLRCTLLEVAHHDHIAVELKHLDGIFNGLLIEIARAGHLCIRETGYMTAQAVHRGFVCQAGAGGRLIKSCYQSLISQKIGILAVASNRLQLFGNLKDTEKLITFELFQRKNVTTCKTTHFTYSF